MNTSKKLQFATGGHPLKKDDFELMQENVFGFMSNISKFIESDGTFKVWGAVVTENPTTISWTEGAIFFNGILYSIEAGSIAKTISFAPFWAISTEYESPDPTQYEDGSQHNVHLIYIIKLKEEQGIGDVGIFDSQLKSLPVPLIDLNLNTGSLPGSNIPVTFTITNISSGLISVNSSVINTGDIKNVSSGDNLVINFSRPSTSVGAIIQINNQTVENIFPLASTSNTITYTVPNITAATSVKITWWPYTHQFRIYRTAAQVTSDIDTYVSRMESYPVENAISYLYLTLAQINAKVRVLLLKSIDTSNLLGTGGFVSNYIVYGTPTITQFKINGVDQLSSLTPNSLFVSNNELNTDGSPGGYYYVNTMRYYHYNYLRWDYLIPEVASDIDITLSYTRANDGNGQLPPEPISGGGGCLLEGTYIDTTDTQELYKIEDIRVGHELLVMNPKTRQQEVVKVISKQNYFVNQIFTINNLLVTTGGHQQYIKRNNDYVICSVENLVAGDIIFTKEFGEIVIETIEITSSNKNKFIVYNIEVEGGFYVANGIITHNKTALPAEPVDGGNV